MIGAMHGPRVAGQVKFRSGMPTPGEWSVEISTGKGTECVPIDKRRKYIIGPPGAPRGIEGYIEVEEIFGKLEILHHRNGGVVITSSSAGFEAGDDRVVSTDFSFVKDGESVKESTSDVTILFRKRNSLRSVLASSAAVQDEETRQNTLRNKREKSGTPSSVVKPKEKRSKEGLQVRFLDFSA